MSIATADTRPEAQHLRDLALLRRDRDRIDREYAQPYDEHVHGDASTQAGIPGGDRGQAWPDAKRAYHHAGLS